MESLPLPLLLPVVLPLEVELRPAPLHSTSQRELSLAGRVDAVLSPRAHIVNVKTTREFLERCCLGAPDEPIGLHIQHQVQRLDIEA